MRARRRCFCALRPCEFRSRRRQCCCPQRLLPSEESVSWCRDGLERHDELASGMGSVQKKRIVVKSEAPLEASTRPPSDDFSLCSEVGRLPADDDASACGARVGQHRGGVLMRCCLGSGVKECYCAKEDHSMTKDCDDCDCGEYQQYSRCELRTEHLFASDWPPLCSLLSPQSATHSFCKVLSAPSMIGHDPLKQIKTTRTTTQRKSRQRGTQCLRSWGAALQVATGALLLLLALATASAEANTPPRFVLNGQSEIVIRLTEGDDTPAGTNIYTLRGYDEDGDKLTFGIRGTEGQELLSLEHTGPDQALVFLNKALDRELKDEYTVVLTLTDGRLGQGNFVTQSMLLLIEDINDNEPIFKPHENSVTVFENSPPKVLTTLEATDEDEGPFGQVIYKLDPTSTTEADKFSVSTVEGKGVLRLVGDLDYERKSLYHLRVLAVDRAISGRVNTGTAAVLVRVLDVEDQPPEFIQVPPVTRIPEDIPVNSGVLEVKAIDGDRGVNNRIVYSMLEGDQSLFTLERDTGVLYVKRPLDRENLLATNGAIIIKIQAEEESAMVTPAPSVTTEVTVLLEDVNDETPTFRASHYIAEVAEGSQFNMPVNLIGDAIPEVYDHDQGNNGTFRMFLEGDEGMFDVTPPEGVNLASFLIRVRNPALLDFEKVKVVNFTVIARETVEDRPKSSSALVTVHIRDTNDNFPEFEEEQYEARVSEDAAVGTTVAWVQAFDQDSGDFGTQGIRYTDLRGPLADSLILDPLTGVITLKDENALDREKVATYFLTVEARDDQGRGNRNTVGVRVLVEDVNDHPPIFLQRRYEANLRENSEAFEEPFFVTARDDDLNGTVNHEVRYSIVGGDPKGNFSIDTMKGELRPMAPLDYEAMDQQGDIRFFNLTVKAYDLGEPPLSNTVPVVVYLQDENDHAPHFEKVLYRKAIPEDTPGGTSVLQVFAWDLDGSSINGRVAYRIQQGALDKFVIDADTGEISVASGAVLDPDRTEAHTTTYILEVIALDGGIGAAQLQARTLVNITVLDVNNKRPIFNHLDTVRVRENVNVGHYVAKVEAQDLDARPILRFSLDPAHSEARNEDGAIVKETEYNYTSAFQIDPIDGVVRTERGLDREKVEVLRLAVVCEDLGAETGPQTATTTLTVIVEDSNDNDPQFRKSFYRRNVAENAKSGTTIVNVVADDVDKNRSITYLLEGVSEIHRLIHLDTETGEVVVADRVDREKFPWLNFTIRAEDSGVPPRSSVVDVFVQVIDENDNNPVFVQAPSNLTVREDTPPGTKVVTVEARDADEGDFGKISYLLDRRSSHGKFKIDPDTGEVSVASPLNREDTESFDLIIEAWDNYQFGYSSGESRNAFTHIFIRIEDINDEIPVFESRNDCATVNEFHEAREVIVEVRATDADDPDTPNGKLRFTIEHGNELDLFEIRNIDTTSAHIFAARPLVGQYGNYTLMVQAKDQGFPPNTAVEPFSICVTDFNDHAPRFVSPSVNLTIRVPENATVGSMVIQVKAIDDDIGINGAVRYRIKKDAAGNWNSFAIDQVTGTVTLTKPLDRERQKLYEIRVEAYDQGMPTPLSSDLDLTIYVRNVNDYEPQFLKDQEFVNFTEHKTPGAERYRLLDTVDRDDLDEEENASQVCYFLVGGDIQGAFHIDPFSHELMTAKELDREAQSRYTLLVKATEDCLTRPEPISFFDSTDDTLLKVIVGVKDVNDNPPRFTRKEFTGGITTESDFGLEVMRITAIDLDSEENSRLRYYMAGPVQETLTEGLDNIRRSPFVIDPVTGVVKLNFDPQKGMKGYFDFQVYVNDTDGNSDFARVFIYLLREDQRVRFVLRQTPDESFGSMAPQVRDQIEYFRDYLGNVTGAIVNVDDFKVHENRDGTVDKTKTDLYLHLVDRQDNSVLDVNQVLTMLDQNVEILDPLFKELNVLDTQRAELVVAGVAEDDLLFMWLVGVIVFLTLVLVVTVALCLSQRARYVRQLKAATATAFVGSHDPGINRTSSAVPNTNIHSVEGSNPIWMSGFDNEWFKDEDTLSHPSEGGDSLDDNAVDTSLSPRGDRDVSYITNSSVPNPLSRESSTVGSQAQLTNHEQRNIHDTYRANLYQTFNKMANPLVDKKLETTEL
ncbi:cadherin 88C isoform X2 [Oratosquilla oratoria]|uniref:cadherin 88C isoform X2 n=1 Tax=Oratosquilla oratoria TaxID=337810 RepID=UPI003F764098